MRPDIVPPDVQYEKTPWCSTLEHLLRRPWKKEELETPYPRKKNENASDVIQHQSKGRRRQGNTRQAEVDARRMLLNQVKTIAEDVELIANDAKGKRLISVHGRLLLADGEQTENSKEALQHCRQISYARRLTATSETKAGEPWILRR